MAPPGESVGVILLEDHSRYWAWDVMGSHPGNFETITQAFVGWLRTAPEAEVVPVVDVLLHQNRMALLWARLLMVAAERPEVFASQLWSFATNEHVLLCLDTKKDAIDAVAAFYGLRSEAERRAFEDAIETFDFSMFIDPATARELFTRSLFQQIDATLLATDAARSYRGTGDDTPEIPNRRSFVIESGVSPVADENWWLKEQGVALDAPVHETILAHGKRVVAAMGIKTGQPLPKVADLRAAVQQLSELMEALDTAQANGADAEVIRVVEGNLADGCSAVLSSTSEVGVLSDAELGRIQQITLRLSMSEFPVAEEGVEAAFERFQSWGGPAARVDAVFNLYTLCQIRPAVDLALLDRLDALKVDLHPAVRFAVAQYLPALWSKDKPRMWAIAEHFAANENNQGVLLGITNSFLANVRNSDPGRVEVIVLQVNQRFPDETGSKDTEVHHPIGESVASLTAMLHVWNNQPSAQELLLIWAKAPSHYPAHLRSALFAVRSAMTSGYDKDTPVEKAYRIRSQAFLRAVVIGAADGLRDYFNGTPEGRQARSVEATALAKTLDNACNALYFGSGAFGERRGPEASVISTNEGRAHLLRDVHDLLRLIGEVGTPHTVYYLLQLLEFTLPGEPGLSFDLLSYAMLNGGRKQGYQQDYLGTDLFVRFVGRCLADFREIFRDEARRAALIECLDLFIEAGWPSARRLLYRLPEALQ